jgi:Pectate lyase superfamily protein
VKAEAGRRFLADLVICSLRAKVDIFFPRPQDVAYVMRNSWIRSGIELFSYLQTPKLSAVGERRKLIAICVAVAFSWAAPTTQAFAQGSSDTILAPTTQTLTDAQGNIWSFGAVVSKQYGYAVLRNGVQFAGGQAVQLTLAGGVIWALNGGDRWFMSTATSWTAEGSGPASTSGSAPMPTTIVAPSSQTLTDAQGNIWWFGGLVSKQYGYAVLRNGVQFAGGQAVQLTLAGGVIWALNGGDRWFMSTATSWTAEGSGPASTSGSAPMPTTIVAPSSQTLTDAQGNVWSFGALVSKQYGYAVLRNGVQFAGGQAVQLTLASGVIWALNGGDRWFMSTTTTWTAETSPPSLGSSTSSGGAALSSGSSGSAGSSSSAGSSGPGATASNCANFDSPASPLQLAPNAIGEEFVGPFKSWADVKQDYGAKGDGVTDDTAALQSALNSLSAAGKSPVLYMPAGIYLVTQTITVQSAQNISVIGQDPASTILKWGGLGGGTLFHINAVAYSRFDRLSFDGGGRAGVLIDQSAVPNTAGGYFDTGNEYADDIFENAGIGIQGGQYGGAAESTVLRSQFVNQSTAGIILKNFNALDWWVWYSSFYNNTVGITNNPGAGNFYAYNNVFIGSTFADLSLANTGNFSFRDNFSLNSALFLLESYYYTNAAVTSLTGNRVISNSAKSKCGGCSLYQGNMGPTIMTDNIFVSPPNASGAAVDITAMNPPDCISVGNTFTQNQTVQCGSFTNGPGRLISVDDKVVAASSINQSPPALPGAPTNLNRQIIDVASGAQSSAIQQAISQASLLCGHRPVVHLPYGGYTISQTLTIPANCDIQLIGDGGQTVLNWAGRGPAIKLQGPSRAILRDFYLNNVAAGTGIEVQNTDQIGSRVFMLEPMVLGSSTAGIFVDGLDNTFVELEDTQIAGNTAVGLMVVGGPLAQKGTPQSGRTNIFAGSSSANYLSYEASKGANLVVRDAYYESITASTYGQASDSSSATFEGSRMATGNEWSGAATNLDAVDITNMSCRVTVLTSAPDTPVAISGSFSGAAWVAGNNFGTSTSYYSNNFVGTSGASFNLNRKATPSAGSSSIPDPDPIPSAAFIRTSLAQSRAAKPSQVADLMAGVTDLRLYRVTVNKGSIGIHLAQ